ncbi:hypothetical protein PR202_gb07189 [Eleusine coracana subsp. coracana]|uniref:RING-type domain-containing protein n=1 Tax=Eleusine coracana subsp. coracana TaxID=191504 RepID=A0AAV5E921_ELECO|nr:hypothetical protein PR202_gb07189 [Eleusine coracana subsp. coracana]
MAALSSKKSSPPLSTWISPSLPPPGLSDIAAASSPAAQASPSASPTHAPASPYAAATNPQAKIQEMKEKDTDALGEKDSNSHVCKVCFESAAAAVLLPCRHFCLCKPCSLACSECPLCRQRIADRIITFT